MTQEKVDQPWDPDDRIELNEPINFGRVWMLLASVESKLGHLTTAQRLIFSMHIICALTIYFSAYREAKKRLETAVAMWSDLGICLNYIELDKIEDAKFCVDKLYKEYEKYPEFIAVSLKFKLSIPIFFTSNL